MVTRKLLSLASAVIGLLTITTSATPIDSLNSVTIDSATEALIAPADLSLESLESRSVAYWVSKIARDGKVPYNDNSSYVIFRDVTEYGADSTGKTDSTDAINKAISDGGRCGYGCDSSTIYPAIVYFPAGTYLVSSPLQMYYYTQMIGDAIDPPTIKAASGFSGIAVIDSDPYTSSGDNWYTNQNNFYRQVRNFIIDLKSMPETSGAGIHWQVAQATSLQNIVFNMIEGTSSAQIGIYMDNGSGGFMSDLTFNGGNYGAFFGNQQFTTRNMTFNNCNTAIYMNWNWAWTLQDITINSCTVGIDMSNVPTDQSVGSVLLLDSTFTDTTIGVRTAYNSSSTPVSAGTLVIDNVDFTGASVAVENYKGTTILAGGSIVTSWMQGKHWAQKTGSRIQKTLAGPTKPSVLLGSDGSWFTMNKPQYETYAYTKFVHVRTYGAVGDGSTDDTAAIQKAMNAVGTGQILYFDHGNYVVSSTINVPATITITGEIWPVIMAYGDNFADQDNPTPVFKVGTAGESGSVQMSDLIFSTKGSAPGAILVQWNIDSEQGDSGMWDCHWRIGGAYGTEMQSDTCLYSTGDTTADSSCEGAYLLFHATTKSSNVYLENAWAWVADHELDLSGQDQLNIYSGRGILIESQGPVWLWGTAAEHSVLYNYQILNAKNVFMGLIQSETPYFQPYPKANVPFTANTAWHDPTFALCSTQNVVAPCYTAFGLRIIDSTNVFVYGTGMYSWFEDYSQTCVANNDCQQNMIQVLGTNSNVNLYGVSTKAAKNMITWQQTGVVFDADNRSNYCGTIALWTNRAAG